MGSEKSEPLPCSSRQVYPAVRCGFPVGTKRHAIEDDALFELAPVSRQVAAQFTAEYNAAPTARTWIRRHGRRSVRRQKNTVPTWSQNLASSSLKLRLRTTRVMTQAVAPTVASILPRKICTRVP